MPEQKRLLEDPWHGGFFWSWETSLSRLSQMNDFGSFLCSAMMVPLIFLIHFFWDGFVCSSPLSSSDPKSRLKRERGR